jgi:hypothetical protein
MCSDNLKQGVTRQFNPFRPRASKNRRASGAAVDTAAVDTAAVDTAAAGAARYSGPTCAGPTNQRRITFSDGVSASM